MTVREFYSVADGDYNEALSGLGKEERILKYLRKFPETHSSGNIRTALDLKDYETAFREAHNLKGMCLNIAISKLGRLSSDLTESLRNGPKGDIEALYEPVKAEYERICELIKEVN